MIANQLQEGCTYRVTKQGSRYYGEICIILELERDSYRQKVWWFWPDLDMMSKSDWMWQNEEVTLEKL